MCESVRILRWLIQPFSSGYISHNTHARYITLRVAPSVQNHGPLPLRKAA